VRRRTWHGLTALFVASAVATMPELARAQPAASGVFPEPRIVARALDIGLRTGGQGTDREKSGLYPELSSMITGAGWISGGPGYRQWLFGDRLRLEGSAAVSWRLYRAAQASAEVTNLARSRIALGVEARWQDATQVTYFGDGPQSLETNRSEYRLSTRDVVGYATYRPTRWLAADIALGRLAAPHVQRPSGPFRRGYPDAVDIFPSDPAFARDTQPAYVHATVSLVADTRNHRGHPTAGGVYRAAWSRYDDRTGQPAGFDRYEGEAATFVPIPAAHLVLAAHGWVAATSPTDGRTLPLYLLPALGGSTTLRGYADYRFHDRHLAVVNVEARLALFTHVDAAIFVDAGSVASRIRDLGLDRRSYGGGVRLHTGTATIARFDVARGGDGWRVLLRTSDPLRLSRLARRTAAAPFVP
jgi:hypothetical protein